ncbi:MAG: DNA/RNA non-specific endonuclease [Bacteroidia bacterium]|nr:DNA/RNA non-specific endonuclease [Bacteroidia bacterium]
MKPKTIIAIVVICCAIIVLVIVIIYSLSDKEKTLKPVYLNISALQDGYPSTNDSSSQIVKHTAYHLLYNEQYEQASWVAYILTKNYVLSDNAQRSDNFREDTNVVTNSATPADYERSDYDRGHLAPAADMKWSEQAMDESFLMSNICPQNQSFNRGIWKKLEERVRNWAVENDSLYIVTGPVLKDITENIGENQVGIPKYFYKVILDISYPDYSGIAFFIENKKSRKNISEYAISIDSLEKRLGYDFFYKSDTSVMNKIENHIDMDKWFE